MTLPRSSRIPCHRYCPWNRHCSPSGKGRWIPRLELWRGWSGWYGFGALGIAPRRPGIYAWANGSRPLVFPQESAWESITDFLLIELEDFTLQAIEQKKLGGSCKYLLQALQVPPLFDFVDGFVSFDCDRGFRCTAFSPLILYVCNDEHHQLFNALAAKFDTGKLC